MPKLAKNVSINPDGGHGVLRIDGDDFPYYIAADGIEVEPSINGCNLHRINLSILFEGILTISTAK